MGISMDRDQVGSTRLSLLDASMPKSTQLLKWRKPVEVAGG